ncbi:flagellar hook assembly protein FlgD [Photorhabdus bodei]|uniref:Basal-body rod modification protein FlgD n=1 Tax=Photorhabdus bodei TaxID=2029681 RepID=A0A329XCF2_9GAMM|nr:flagellar hook assembly protein FlgD [Photorhabdus bodei]NDK98295.1 flagellar hook assembly protein FlgD [Photorhabdus bodei]NDL02546.1 flagellar hook assembly protein FlgD [Photorhabdus bodei]NDL06620.1 flagellar hook assembly protein FlgD [Photorhabdus bodei]RAX13008.1 flagellar hook assembly protein FlgD [Photorhabdus bodei]
MAITSSVNGARDNTIVGESALASKKKGSEELNSNFMKLLVAQMQNQDPTNPMKNNELTSHLAQINTLAGIEKLNTTLGSIVGQINNNQPVQASALIGRGVMIPGNTILAGLNKEAGNVSTTPYGIELERPADSVQVTITDKQGGVVRQIDLGGLEAGVHSFHPWDGKKEDGTNVEDGAYNFTITASYKGEQRVFQPLRFAKVNGVTRDADGAKLDLGRIGAVTMDQIRQIL